MSSWGFRVCAGCGNNLCADEFSNNQWRKGFGYSRCTLCVQEGIEVDEGGFQTARTNRRTTRVSYSTRTVFASGTFRNVYLGRYTGGDRTGQNCAVKFFKRSYINYEDEYFERDLYAAKKALKIIIQWNQAGFIDDKIRLNMPEKWHCNTRDRPFLLEPFIDNYQKFNSNSGWCDQSKNFWNRVMQALSHYSYHISSGQFLLCDLQGGVNHLGVILTDPVIMSHNKRFGLTDLGRKGIINFFHSHRCNRFCRDHWTRPAYTQQYFQRTRGTTMLEYDDDDEDDDDDGYCSDFSAYTQHYY